MICDLRESKTCPRDLLGIIRSFQQLMVQD